MKSKKLLSLTLATVILSSTVAMAGGGYKPIDFTDISGHWGQVAIEKLGNQYGAINGYEDKTFRPDKPITREEMATIMARLHSPLEIDTKDYVGGIFSDVNIRYSSAYIDYLANKGIVNGYEDKTFRPEKYITREEFATIAYRYAEDRNIVDKNKKSSLNDKNEVSPWAEEAVSVLIGNGIIKGMGDNNFKPQNNLTRAEATQMIYRMIDLDSHHTKIMVTNTDVVLLSEAKEDAEPIKKNSNLKAGTKVVVEGATDDYHLIRPLGVDNASRGYVLKKYIDEIENKDEYEKKEMIALKEIKLLSEAKEDADLIKKNNTLPKDSVVIVEGEATDYYLVRPVGIEDASRGYVLKTDLKDKN